MTLKIFTADWLGADTATQRRAVAEYLSTLEELSGACPPAVLEFGRHHTLHDGLLVGLEVVPDDRTALLRIHGWNLKFDERRLYTLLYRGLESFVESGPPDADRTVRRSIDASYDEFHPSGTGAFEHRIAFHSDVEFCFVFREFEFHYEVTPLRGTG